MAGTGTAVASQPPAACICTPRPWAERTSLGLPVASPPVRAAVQPNCLGALVPSSTSGMAQQYPLLHTEHRFLLLNKSAYRTPPIFAAPGATDPGQHSFGTLPLTGLS
ncbi:hypothetical protein OH77DRAFT_587538 [Trametes cingulata]|nr:hypothetical protein OH77DRAFT_587538 [Trametes cingulata]